MKKAIRPHRSALLRKWCQLLVTVLAFTSAQAQGDAPRYSPINGYGFKYKRHAVDSILLLPLYASPHAPYRAGALKYRESDSAIYKWTGAQWLKEGGDVSGKLDSVTIHTATDPDPDTLYQWRAGVSELVGLIPKGGGSGTNNANAGAGYRVLKPVTQELKTLFSDITGAWDSVSNTNGLTYKVDSVIMSTRAWRKKGDDSVAAVLRQVIIDTAAAIRADFPAGGSSDSTETEVRKGIGVDTSTGPPTPDTLLIEEEYLHTTIDQKTVIADQYADDDQSDSNDGETVTTAKQTLTAAQTNLIARSFAKGYSTGLLRANSVFREQFTPTNNGIRLSAWGLFDGRNRQLPMISASIALTGGADTASMYKLTKTHSLGAGNPGYDYFTIVEIDTAMEKYYPYLARKYLRIVSSIALCDATPGSVFQPNMVSPTPIYVNPTEGNVGSNKYRYEIGDKLSTIYSVGYTGQYTYLWLENGVSGYGTVGGTNGGVKDIYLGRSVLQGGATHTSVIKSGMVEECVYVTGALGGANGNTAHVFYQGNGLGNYGIFRRSIMFDYENFLLAHQGEGVNDPIEYIAFKDSYLFGDSANRGIAMGTGVVRRADITGNYLEYSNAFYRGGAWDNRIINNVFRDIQDESGVEVPSNLSRPSTLVDNIIEFFPVNTTGTIFMWSVNQNLHNTDFNHNTVYSKAVTGSSEPTQLFARNNTFGSNTPFDVRYNIFISSTASGTRTRVVTVDQNSSAGVTDGYVADYNVYIILAGDGFRWVVLNPSSGGPNKDGLSVWQAATNQDDNSIEIDLTSNPDALQDIFVDPANGNWALTNSTNANLIRALGAGKRNPPTFYPKRPLPDEAITAMISGGFKSPTEIWQTPNYAGGSVTVDGSETKIVAGAGITVTGTGTIPDQYVVSATGSGGGIDSTVATTLFWNLEGNTLGGPKKWGAIDLRPISLINGNVNWGFSRTSGQFVYGPDTTGITDVINRVAIKSTTALPGLGLMGSISGTAPSFSNTTSHTATANNQTVPIISMNNTLSAGGFTGVTFRPIQIIADYASGTSNIYVRNTASAGTVLLTLDGSDGQARLYSAGRFWATAGNAMVTAANTSFQIMMEKSFANPGANFDSSGLNIGDGTRAAARLAIRGNKSQNNWGLTGIQMALLSATYTDINTAGSGTVAHTVANGIAQPTFAALNTSVTFTNASTWYIANAPAAGTNVTITNPYALYVAAGKSHFGDDINIVDAAAAQLRLTHTAGTQYGEIRVDGSGNWFLTGSNTSPLLGLGGTTSAFPALIRDGASIQVKLADNSANANLKVLDQGYSESIWNGNDEVPTKNAVRDKFESLTTPTTLYSGNGTLASAREISGGGFSLDIGTSGSPIAGLILRSSTDLTLSGTTTLAPVSTATDANYTVSTGASVINLPTITANRVVSLPTATAGRLLIIWNQNSSGNSWSFNGLGGATVVDPAGTNIANLANDAVYILLGAGSDWLKIN